MRLYVLFIILWIGLHLHGQDNLLEISEHHYRSAEYEEALKSLEAAQMQLRQQGDHLNLVKAIIRSAEISEEFIGLASAKKHISMLESLHEITLSEPEARVLILMALAEWEDETTSTSHLNNARKIIDGQPTLSGKYMPRIYALKGLHYYNVEKFDSTIAMVQLGVEAASTQGDHASTAECYLYWAKALRRKGDQLAAIPLIKEAIVEWEQAFGRLSNDRATAFNDLGMVHADLNRPEEAHQYYQEALNLREEIFGRGSAPYARIMNNMILNLRSLDRYEEAISLATENIAHQDSRANPDPTFHPAAYNTLGELLEQTGAYPEAKRNYEIAVDLFSEYNPGSKRLRFYLLDLVRLSGRMGDHAAALRYIQQVMGIALSGIDPENLHSNPNPNSADNYQTLKTLTRIKAQALFDHFNSGAGDLDDLKSAAEVYALAAHFAERNRQETIYQKSRLSYSRANERIYQGAIEALAKLFAITQEQQWLAGVFEMMEKSKSLTLLEDLMEASVFHQINLPSEVLERERMLLDSIQTIRAALREQVDSTSRTFESALLEINLEYEQHKRDLARRYPQYHRARHQLDFMTLAELQRGLSSDESVLEYYLSSQVGYLLHITHDQVQFHEFPSDSLDSKIYAIRRSIADYDHTLPPDDQHNLAAMTTFGRASKALQKSLLPEKVQPRSFVRIVPHGVLNHLPFDLVAVSDPQRASARETVFFEKHVTSYAYSCTLAEQMRSNTVRAGKDILILAPKFEAAIPGDTSSQAVMLGPLHHNEQEANFIAEVIPGKILKGDHATRSTFLEEQPAYGLLHFATHALVDQAQPDRSLLAFSRKGEPSDLLLNELYSLDIPAHLVTLSACRSSDGKLQAGEGQASLASGFSYAGAKSLVTSLWEVTDVAAPQIMRSFYANLALGMRKDQALHEAKTQFIGEADPMFSHPYFWSTFIAIGDMSPLPERQYRWVWMLLIALSVPLLLFKFLYRA